jgi:hypothetical protein
MMKDDFESHSAGLSSPATGAQAITPNDSQLLARVPRAIYVGGTGSLSVEMVGGVTVTFQSLQAGAIYPLRIRKVRASGTTATHLVALW